MTIPEWRRREYPPEEVTFFGQHYQGGRKRKKSGYLLAYNRADPIFNRFLNRFYPDGNLSFGERRYFIPDNAQLEIVGCQWPKSKARPKKQPRRSILASQPTDETDYVYLIRMGRTRLYKIGKSNDPQGRLVSLQSASPYKLKLLHTFKADNAAAAEESLHATLHDNRLEGEWFKLSDAQQKALTSVTEYKAGHFVVGKKTLSVKDLLAD